MKSSKTLKKVNAAFFLVINFLCYSWTSVPWKKKNPVFIQGFFVNSFQSYWFCTAVCMQYLGSSNHYSYRSWLKKILIIEHSKSEASFHFRRYPIILIRYPIILMEKDASNRKKTTYWVFHHDKYCALTKVML